MHQRGGGRMYAAVFDDGAAMEPQILLSRIKSLLASAPDFSAYSPASAEHLSWLARGHALVASASKSVWIIDPYMCCRRPNIEPGMKALSI